MNTDVEKRLAEIRGKAYGLHSPENSIVNDLQWLLQHIATLEADRRRVEEGMQAWRDYYKSELETVLKSINEIDREADPYGYNFFCGKKSGLINHDIGLAKLKAALSEGGER